MPAKIRSGFVSNSSSSSFILNFDEEINSKEQLHDNMFKEETEVDSDYSTMNSKEFCDKLFNDYIKGTKPNKTEAIYDICSEIDINGEWDFDSKTGYNKILRIDLKNWFLQYDRWEYFAILRIEIAMKEKKYKNLIEQIKNPYICSIDDGNTLHDILMSNEHLFQKILLHINNNH